MATSQSQSKGIEDLLEDQKKIFEELDKKKKSEGTFKEKDIRSAMYEQYRKIEEIMQLIDGRVIYDWDEYFMNVACLAALRSKDPRTPVGACIVTANNTVVGIGYNSMPYTEDENNDHLFPWKGCQDYSKSKNDLDNKFPYVVHAAVNAITNRTIKNLEGCTIYQTLPPDEDCAHAIIQSGISHVKYGKFIKRRSKTKMPNIELAEELLRLQKVCYSHFKTPVEPQVTVTAASGNDIQISLSERIKKAAGRDVTTYNEPEKDLILTWEQFFMSLAMLSAKKQGSHERYPKWTQGACIVSEKDKQVISVGFSGYPESMDRRAIQKVIENNSPKGSYICHAEYDAILSKRTPSVKGYTLYVTKYPCNECAKLIVQSGIKEVVYVKEGEMNTITGKKYIASRIILATALHSKEEDSIKETAREVIELMVIVINNIAHQTRDKTDIQVKTPFQTILEDVPLPKQKISIIEIAREMMEMMKSKIDNIVYPIDIQRNLDAAPFPKEKDFIKEIAREVIKLMESGIDNIVDSTADETDNINIVERVFQNILDPAPLPKEKNFIEEIARKVITLMKSGIDKIGTAIDMVKAFQIVLKVALSPMKEVRKFEEVKDLELINSDLLHLEVSFRDQKVSENHSTVSKKKMATLPSTSAENTTQLKL